MKTVNVIGAGLAGCEATYQLIKRGFYVKLYEMRPVKETGAHVTEQFAELVCSNSLRADGLGNAVGVLKEEMRLLDSLVMAAADATRVPAGGALAVDRVGFSTYLTNYLESHPQVDIYREEITAIPEGPTILASGPLTSASLAEALRELTGEAFFYFYDAPAPIIHKDSIDFDKVYLKSRWDKGEAAYLNCPMTEKEYHEWYDALINAEVATPKDFEKGIFFEGCMPIEVMAGRGIQTPLFGPMKPVGLVDPKTGKTPYAVVQLRQDDAAASLYNIVGFQTSLKWPDQKRLIQMIPGLEQAEIVRYGVMHKNSFVNSPAFMNATYQTKKRADLFLAGQITGVEGYVESAASGLVAGINMAKYLAEENLITFSPQTAIGALAYYITHANRENFQPMNVNFGLFETLEGRIKKKEKKEKYAQRAICKIKTYLPEVEVAKV
ncbi:MAG: methylenetetrahydrofolate--tRNA-(uracil(54)-C(5))-methyltransferase (FADH(2)-oxidizing) TrmFO [Defluviitaleaceae bacterium]|nr:methylenetetrahydrofolate--tRNA-(uracil(54)-C(5))-methyltransferase (FADH(2)-oxidizing) TrmFO [Defluviitaleaceae bacterium]